MLFSSVTFIYLFLPIVLIVYYGLLRKHRSLQNAFLLFASLLFYAWGEPKFVAVMILSIIVNWGLGLAVNKFKAEKEKTAKFIIFLTVLFNLGAVHFFNI
jgi:alginate O-acetyltransferase complex protein AlgI